jgi:hypothetical protein
MKKINIIIISLCLSVFILTSVVHADVIIPGTSSKDPSASSKDPSTSSKDELNSLLIILAAIIGIIALIAWLVIRKIKKYNDSKREPKIRA